MELPIVGAVRILKTVHLWLLPQPAYGNVTNDAGLCSSVVRRMKLPEDFGLRLVRKVLDRTESYPATVRAIH